jgi:hypothetical protein
MPDLSHAKHFLGDAARVIEESIEVAQLYLDSYPSPDDLLREVREAGYRTFVAEFERQRLQAARS